ncbi:unknown [Azospirillum sp. CAG:239]|jgi:hypothetical protein|nr:unknown [Azospirillum sp. CAG:239]
MIMCERIERLVVNEFEKLTGVNASENQVMKFEVFPQKREALKQLLRSVLPDLRIYSSVGLVTVADFANYIEKAEEKKKTFFDRGLQIIREATGNENLSLDDDLYPELRPSGEGNAYLSAQSRYFIAANRVYNALSAGLKGHFAYYPPVSQLEKCRTLREMIDLYYRRGRF